MANPARGEVRRTSEGYTARITLRGKERKTFTLPTCRDDVEAQTRADLLAKLARDFRRAKVLDTPDAPKLLDMAASATPALLAGVVQVAKELVGGELPGVADGAKVPTFGEVVTEWTDGTLRKRFPDQIRDAGAQHLDTAQKRVARSCFDGLRDIPIDRVTREHCDEVMRSIPLPPKKKELSRSTRRQYAVLINYVLNLSELAGYIRRNPIPRGWAPKPGSRKRFPVMYPAEDRTLLEAENVPLCWRMYYGALHREGPRRDEFAKLRVRDIDFDHETIALDENKTDHARMWKLTPGVAPALAWWVKSREAEPDDLVFVDENGGPLRLDHMADRLRGHMKAAELDRADLYSKGDLKSPFGTHCFRRSYVTRSLSMGLGEDHVRQRTGHSTDELLKYRQPAMGLRELNLGDLDRLDQAIPEVRRGLEEAAIAPPSPTKWSGREDSNLRPLDPQSSALSRLRYAPASRAFECFGSTAGET